MALSIRLLLVESPTVDVGGLQNFSQILVTASCGCRPAGLAGETQVVTVVARPLCPPRSATHRRDTEGFSLEIR